MNRSFSRIIAVFVAFFTAIYPIQANAEVISLSNGVSIQEFSAVGNTTETRVSYGGENMTVAVTNESSRDTIVIDGELVLEFTWRTTSTGEEVLDHSTFTYAGQTATRYEYEEVYREPCVPCYEPCPPDYSCPGPVLHPAAVAQVELLTAAMNDLHSASFLQAVNAAESELGASGMSACGWAIAGHVGSWISIAGCASGIGCVLWIALHTYSGYQVAKNCSAASRRR